MGDYILSLDDYLESARLPDEICRNSYFIDVHLTRAETTQADKIDVEKRIAHYGKGRIAWHPVSVPDTEGFERTCWWRDARFRVSASCTAASG